MGVHSLASQSGQSEVIWRTAGVWGLPSQRLAFPLASLTFWLVNLPSYEAKFHVSRWRVMTSGLRPSSEPNIDLVRRWAF